MNRLLIMFLDLLFYICTIWCFMEAGAWAYHDTVNGTTNVSLLVFIMWLMLGGLFFGGARLTHHILEKDAE